MFGSPNIENLSRKGDVGGLIKALDAKDAQVSRGAADALVQIGDRAIQPLIESLKVKSGEYAHKRESTIHALRRLGDPTVEALIHTVRDTNSPRRGDAAEVLGELGDPRAIAPLVELLSHSDLDRVAMWSLSRLGKDGFAALGEALRHRDLGVRLGIVVFLRDLLADVKDRQWLEPLVGLLENETEDWRVRAVAAVALGNLGDPRAVEPMTRRLEALGRQSDGGGIRMAVAEALGRIGDSRAVPASERVSGEVLADAVRSCDRCGNALQQLDMSRGALTVGVALPELYDGVVCTLCDKLECSACKGTPFDAPCSWCGGEVSPAYASLVPLAAS